MTNSSLLERAAARIDGLIDRGAHICGAFNPEGETLHCHRCGYPADTHLIRDLRLALEAQPACQHGSVCRAHFETLRERCEAAEAALEARAQERDDWKLSFETSNEHVCQLEAAKDAAEANLAAEQLGNQTITDELIRQHRVAEANLQALERELRVERDMGRPWKEEVAALREQARVAEAKVQELHEALAEMQCFHCGDRNGYPQSQRTQEVFKLRAIDAETWVNKPDTTTLRHFKMGQCPECANARALLARIEGETLLIKDDYEYRNREVEKAATYQIHPRDREPVEPTEPQKGK